MKYLLHFFMVLFVTLPLWASCNSYEEDNFNDRPDVPEDRPDVVIRPTESDSIPTESDSIPTDTDSIPTDTVPVDTIPADTLPVEPQHPDTIPYEEIDFTVPFEVRNPDGVIIRYQMTSDSTCTLVYSDRYKSYSGCIVVPAVLNLRNKVLTVTKLEDKAFLKCSGITIIDLPSTITMIGEEVFTDCTKLTAINIDSANPDYYSHEGVLYKTALHSLMKYPQNKGGDYIIPDGTTRIRVRALERSKIRSVVIPSSVTMISTYSFAYCDSLQSVEIGDGLERIESWAFYGCEKLGKVVLGKGLKYISYRVFDCCNLAEVTIRATTPPSCEETALPYGGRPRSALYVPQGTRQVYEQAPQWKLFGSIVEE